VSRIRPQAGQQDATFRLSSLTVWMVRRERHSGQTVFTTPEDNSEARIKKLSRIEHPAQAGLWPRSGVATRKTTAELYREALVHARQAADMRLIAEGLAKRAKQLQQRSDALWRRWETAKTK
jgi:hypothetical protein